MEILQCNFYGVTSRFGYFRKLLLTLTLMVLSVFYFTVVLQATTGFSFATSGFQQQIVQGKVTDSSDGSAMPGVNIIVKGTTRGAMTDLEGNYTIEGIGPDDILVFSFVGYTSLEIPVSGRTIINVSLEPSAQDIDEVVVVGYGQQKKTSLTSAVSTLKAEKLTSVPASNLTTGLGGRLAGLIVRQTSGEPGQDYNNIYIRGRSSTGTTDPLLVVDGIPRNFSDLDPNTVESFTVLKDAAAVAPYGVAGANGVILVTTKRGSTGAPTLSYSGYMGFQNPTVLPELMSAYEYAGLKNAASLSVGGVPLYNDYDLQKFADGTDPDGHPNQNVYDLLFNKNTPLTRHNFEITGGTDRVRYYGSLGYQYQKGLFEEFYNNRYNFSISIDAEVTKTTNISMDIKGREQLNNGLASTNLWEQVHYATDPTRPILFSNGFPGDFISAALRAGSTRRQNLSQLFTQLSIDQELPFVPGLSVKGTFAFDPTFRRTKLWWLPAHMWTIDTTKTPYEYNEGIVGLTKPQLTHSISYASQYTYQAGMTYSKNFGKHDIGALVLFEAKANDVTWIEAKRINYDVFIDELNMGSEKPEDISNSGSSSKERQMGIVYRLTYNYEQKYLFEATGRNDGHYYFAPEKRWGFFPAVSAAWRISEENFMQNISWMDNLKIRGSYGESGALAGTAFQYLSMYNVYGPAAVIDGAAVQAVREGIEPNKNITWEKAKKSNVGVDLTLWRGLLRLEADYFYEMRSNMLTTPTVIVPAEYGVGLSQVNAGVMENRGVEFTVGSNYKVTNDLRISVDGNFTFARNKLLEVFETSTTYDNPNRRQTGRPLGTRFGYEAIGYFQEEDFDAFGNLLPGIATQPWGKVYPGDVRYKDVNEDGKIDTDDHTVIGLASVPEIIYGMSLNVSYKGFFFDILFQGVGRTNIYGSGGYWHPFYNGRGAYKSNLDYWTPENRDASHCRITPAPLTNNDQPSSYLIFNTRYFRLKSLNLSYTIPSEYSKKVGIQNARVFISGQNLLTFTPIINYDPEIIQQQGLAYPLQKVVSLGVNLKLN